MARIILVDDDPVIGELVSAAMFAAGHATGWIHDGASALKIMRARPPNLAIIDCAMPGMGGLDLVRAMRVDPLLSHVPIIMLTARNSHSDETLAFTAGADDYLRKPVDLDQLVARAEIMLNTPRWQVSLSA